MAPFTIFQQGSHKVTFDPATADYNFITPGQVRLNGRALSQAPGVFNGEAITSNFTVTGYLGDGRYDPRTITLGDRDWQPRDLVIQAVAGPLRAPQLLPVPVGGEVSQLLGEAIGPFETDVGGKKPTDVTQKLRLYVAALNDGPEGTAAPLQAAAVQLRRADTGEVLSEVALPSMDTASAATFTLLELELPYVHVPALVAPELQLVVTGGSWADGLVTHSLVVGCYSYPDLSQELPSAQKRVVPAAAEDLGLNLAFALEIVSLRPVSIGVLRFLGVLTDDLEVAEGVKIDGVDISKLEAKVQALGGGALDRLDAIEANTEPKIPIGSDVPAGPVANVSKWVDTHGQYPVLRYFDGTLWRYLAGNNPEADLVGKDLYPFGELKRDLAVAPGVKIAGVDLPALGAELAALREGEFAHVTVHDWLKLGAYGEPFELAFDRTTGTVDANPMAEDALVAQSFLVPERVAFTKAWVYLQAQTGAGSVRVRLRQGAPVDAASDPVLAEVTLPVGAADDEPQGYEFVWPQQVISEPGATYYVDVAPLDGAKLLLKRGPGPSTPDGQAWAATGAAPAWAAQAYDLCCQLEVATQPHGDAHTHGTWRHDGDLTLTGQLILLNPDVNIVTVTKTELELEDNKITLNAGATGQPLLDAMLAVARGDLPDAEFRWNETSDRWETEFPLLVKGVDVGAVAEALGAAAGDIVNLNATLQNLVATVGAKEDGTKNFSADMQYVNADDDVLLAIENLDDSLALEVNDVWAALNVVIRQQGGDAESAECPPWVDPINFTPEDSHHTALAKLDAAISANQTLTLAKNETLSTGLTWVFRGGRVEIDGQVILVPDNGELELPPNCPALHIGYGSAGPVATPEPWALGVIPMATATTNATDVTSWAPALPDYIATTPAGVTFGNAAGTACEGNDGRLSDARVAAATSPVNGDVGGTLGETEVRALQGLGLDLETASVGQLLTVVDLGEGVLGLRAVTPAAGGLFRQQLISSGASAVPMNPIALADMALVRITALAVSGDHAAAFTHEFVVRDAGDGVFEVLGAKLREQVAANIDVTAQPVPWALTVAVDAANLQVSVRGMGEAEAVTWTLRVEIVN